MNSNSWNELIALINWIDNIGDLNWLTSWLLQLNKDEKLLQHRKQEKV